MAQSARFMSSLGTNTFRLRDFLVKTGRGSKGRTEVGEEKNYENKLLSSPASSASSASAAYPNGIALGTTNYV